jgi:hypothetical protein
VVLGIASGSSAGAEDGCGAFEDAQRMSHRRIRWEDFQGPRPMRASPGPVYPKTVVRIATSVHIDEWRVQMTPTIDGEWVARADGLCIRAYMHKDRSGYIAEDRASKDLVHEQGHFDIALLSALALRARALQLEVRAESREQAEERLFEALQRTYRETVAEYKEFDDRYEQATAFGNRSGIQHRWNTQLAARLEAASSESPEQELALEKSSGAGTDATRHGE